MKDARGPCMPVRRAGGSRWEKGRAGHLSHSAAPPGLSWQCPIANCSECVIESNGEPFCRSCDKGYTATKNGTCVPCGDNCAFCNVGDDGQPPACSVCKSYNGHGLKGKECVACGTKGCLDCMFDGTGQETCSVCNVGYGEKDQECVPCTTQGCARCVFGSAGQETCMNCKMDLRKSPVGECVAAQTGSAIPGLAGANAALLLAAACGVALLLA